MALTQIKASNITDGTVVAAEIGADAIDGTKIADNAIDSEHYTDASIDLAHLAADSVDGTKIADDAINSEHYTDASIDNAHLADDAVGVAELSATGTASATTFLRGDNAWAAAGGGGSWNIIGTSVASSSATLSQTGLSSTYDCYAIIFSDLVPATDSQNLCLRVGDSSGYDSGGSDYTKFRTNQSEAANSFAAQNSTGANHIELSGDTGSAAGEGIGGIVYILRPGDGTTQPLLHGFTTGVASDGNTRVNYVGGIRQAVITLDRVQVFFTSGNIATGRMTVYGIAHA